MWRNISDTITNVGNMNTLCPRNSSEEKKNFDDSWIKIIERQATLDMQIYESS